MGFLRRRGQLLDREEQPYGERQGGEDAGDAEWQEGAAAVRQFDAVRAPC